MGRIHPFEVRKARGVTFSYPQRQQRSFELLEEIALDTSDDDFELGDYYFLIQHLKDQHGGHLVRMTYYRRPHGADESSWIFGGQTSITTTFHNWRRLFKAAMEEDWFR